MKALAVQPGTADSLEVVERSVPTAKSDELTVTGLFLGICGTDRELNGGHYGWAPPGEKHLVIGHESLGRVESAPEGSGFAPGDLIAGVVRRPDPVPCEACAHGEFDMCRNGKYTERGIKEIDGYGSQSWVVKKDFAVKLDPDLGVAGVLIEPASVVAKAWDQIYRVGNRGYFDPKSVLINGAGPVGLLTALMGSQRGLDVHVFDVAQQQNKVDLVKQLNGTFHVGDYDKLLKELEPDIIIDTTGVSEVLATTLSVVKPYQLVCLVGMHDPEDPTGIDLASVGKQIVLDNVAIVGTVNANVNHWKQAAKALADAEPSWREAMITRTVPLSTALEAFEHHDDDIKVIIDLQK